MCIKLAYTDLYIPSKGVSGAVGVRAAFSSSAEERLVYFNIPED